MKVVLDTNVVVSAVFFGGPPRTVLDAWAEGRLTVVVTPSIFDEYLRVCPLRISYPEADYQPLLFELLAHGSLMPDLEGETETITADPDDHKFMRCAAVANAIVGLGTGTCAMQMAGTAVGS